MPISDYLAPTQDSAPSNGDAYDLRWQQCDQIDLPLAMLALTLTADLTGYLLLPLPQNIISTIDPHSVTNLQPLDTAEEPYFYTFKVQCTSCRETHPNWVSISRFVRLPHPSDPRIRTQAPP